MRYVNGVAGPARGGADVRLTVTPTPGLLSTQCNWRVPGYQAMVTLMWLSAVAVGFATSTTFWPAGTVPAPAVEKRALPTTSSARSPSGAGTGGPSPPMSPPLTHRTAAALPGAIPGTPGPTSGTVPSPRRMEPIPITPPPPPLHPT